MIHVTPIDPEQWRTWRELRLRALENDSWAFGATLAETLTRDTEEHWRRRIAPPMISFLVSVDGAAAGMARLLPGETPSTPTELISVWVAPEARGRGAGRALITAAAEHHAAHHPGTALRLAVRETNHAARRLYEGCGFRPVGPNPEDELEILMELSHDAGERRRKEQES